MEENAGFAMAHRSANAPHDQHLISLKVPLSDCRYVAMTGAPHSTHFMGAPHFKKKASKTNVDIMVYITPANGAYWHMSISFRK